GSRSRDTRLVSDWSSDVCPSDLPKLEEGNLWIRATMLLPSSSEIVDGIVARIHRLPSSSLGRNSSPSERMAKPASSSSTIAPAKIGRASCRGRGEVAGASDALKG